MTRKMAWAAALSSMDWGDDHPTLEKKPTQKDPEAAAGSKGQDSSICLLSAKLNTQSVFSSPNVRVHDSVIFKIPLGFTTQLCILV